MGSTIINTYPPTKKMFGDKEVLKEVWNGETVYEKQSGTGYLKFSSENTFSIGLNPIKWDANGTTKFAEYKNGNTWNTWDGSTINAGEEDGVYTLYLRGTGITYYADSGSSGHYSVMVMTGTAISCEGEIETLLDYRSVLNGTHPTVGGAGFAWLFSRCTALISPPNLSTPVLVNEIYRSLFYMCSNLQYAPALPALTMTEECYENMFSLCKAITTPPTLPSESLSAHCYDGMFEGCSALQYCPALPALQLANYCYNRMFYGCTALTQGAVLPATTMEQYCYASMFSGCTEMVSAPALISTTLASNCYYRMFDNCSKLSTPPALPAITLNTSCYYEMFNYCTNLTSITELKALELKSNCYRGMFKNCSKIKMSTSQDTTYTSEFCIPASGTGTDYTNALTDMFANTGGSFKGTPSINTSYYTSNTIVSA